MPKLKPIGDSILKDRGKLGWNRGYKIVLSFVSRSGVTGNLETQTYLVLVGEE